jgi:fibronectin-binding autotransporter adhesin
MKIYKKAEKKLVSAPGRLSGSTSQLTGESTGHFMKRITSLTITILALAFLSSQSTFAAARTWGNSGTDFNAGASWGGTAPSSNDVGLFSTAEVTQPNVTANLTIGGLRFSAGATGYDITASAGVTLTINGVNTTGSGGTTTASASFVRNDNTTGTTTIDAPVNLAPSTGISTIFQDAADGSTLVLNGAISQTGTVALSLKNGTIQLNGANSYSGGTTIDAAGTTVVVGNNSGLGTGNYTVNNASSIQAGGGARTVANNFILGGDTTVSGSNAMTINGTVTSSGSNSRQLTVTNSALTTINGNVFLSESDSVARSLTINGTGNVTINGVVTNNNVGNTLGSPLKYSGTGTLTLNNANTYSGGTSINATGGTLIANHDGALGSGNVTLSITGVTVTLQNGTLNNYIGDVAGLSLLTGDTVNLNFTGTPDTVGALTIDGVAQATGLWGSAASGAPNVSADFSGTGEILVTGAAVPEPSTLAMIAIGAASLVGAQIRRKRS